MASKASNYCYCHMDGNNLNGEDSGDENSNCIPRSFAEMIFDNTECYMCNGFFGPCFGEPICATCHAFLFPNYVMSGENSHQFTEKSDDGDSGNDEPTDTLYNMDKQGPCEKFGYCVRRISAIPPPDNLATRLELLSVSSDQNKNNYSASIENLPTEVLLGIFSYLDDFSLWSVANVCRRWRSLALYETPVYKWQQLTTRRFPLFKPLTNVEDWFQTYTSLMNSCSCGICLQQMTVRIRPSGEEGSWRRNRLRSELKILRSDPPDGIQAIPLDSPTCCHWQATIQGPAGSPYEGGIFFLYLQVPYSYPMCPPIVRFLTKIFHPNVSRHGDVGIDSIHYNWSLALTLSKVLISVQSLLTDPYCEVCMEPDIGELYMRDQQKFEAIARRWTWLYAMADILPNS